MTCQPTPDATPEPAAEQAADGTQRYRQVLDELIDMGTELARMVYQQAKARAEAAPAPGPGQDFTIPFDRIARTVRRTIAQARHLAVPLAPQAARNRRAARKRILREVEDVIQRRSQDEAAESLRAELDERLDDPELDEEIDHRPAAEIIADICRDLGIAHAPGTHPWKRRTPADIAELCARAARPRAARTVPAASPRDPPPRRGEAGATLLDAAARFRGG